MQIRLGSFLNNIDQVDPRPVIVIIRDKRIILEPSYVPGLPLLQGRGSS